MSQRPISRSTSDRSTPTAGSGMAGPKLHSKRYKLRLGVVHPSVAGSPDRQEFNMVDVTDPNNFVEGTAIRRSTF